MPKPKILIVALLTIVVNFVPRLLIKFGIFEDGGLGLDISEFSEVMIYFIFLVYLFQLNNEKKWPKHLYFPFQKQMESQ